MTARNLLVVAALAATFVLAPAMLAPIALAVGPTLLAGFAAGCFTLAAVVR